MKISIKIYFIINSKKRFDNIFFIGRNVKRRNAINNNREWVVKIS